MDAIKIIKRRRKKKHQTQTTRGQLEYNTKSTSCCLLKIGLRRRHTQTTQIEPGLLSQHHMTEHLKTEEALSNSTFPKLQSTNTANSSNNIPKNPALFYDDSIESEQQTPKETCKQKYPKVKANKRSSMRF